MKTITLETWRGDLVLTRDQFVKRWTGQIDEVGLWAICHSADDNKIAARIFDDVAKLAGNSFDTLYLKNLENGEGA